MFVTHLIFALFFAIIFTAIFAGALRARGPWSRGPSPWGGILLFFLVIFLAAWAGGVWMTPVGGVIWGGYWLPFLFFALVAALILAAATAPEAGEARTIETPARPPEEDVEEAAAVSVFLWILLIVLALGILLFYVT